MTPLTARLSLDRRADRNAGLSPRRNQGRREQSTSAKLDIVAGSGTARAWSPQLWLGARARVGQLPGLLRGQGRTDHGANDIHQQGRRQRMALAAAVRDHRASLEARSPAGTRPGHFRRLFGNVLAGRELSPKTRSEYQKILNGRLAEFDDLSLDQITPGRIRTWVVGRRRCLLLCGGRSGRRARE